MAQTPKNFSNITEMDSFQNKITSSKLFSWDTSVTIPGQEREREKSGKWKKEGRGKMDGVKS